MNKCTTIQKQIFRGSTLFHLSSHCEGACGLTSLTLDHLDHHRSIFLPRSQACTDFYIQSKQIRCTLTSIEHARTHSDKHTHCRQRDRLRVQLPLPESPHQTDESGHQSRAQEEFRQSAYSSEPDTRVQSPPPCLFNSLFCHFQSQFVTVAWFSGPVPCHSGRGKKELEAQQKT